MPVTQRRSRVLVITKPHDFRHFLLQISPVQRLFRFIILRQSAGRIENRIAAEDEELLDLAIGNFIGQLENAFCVRVARKFADNNGVPEIFKRRVHSVSEQLHRHRLMRSGQNQTRARFGSEVARRFRDPFLIQFFGSARLNFAEQRIQSCIAGSARNLLG